MSAILSSTQTLFTTVGNILISVKVQTCGFIVWLLGMESPPADPKLAAKVSRELSEMAGVIAEHKTSWVSLIVLFGDHKTIARAFTKTLGEVEEWIGAIYASKQKSDNLSRDEKKDVADLSKALRNHISTLEAMSQLFPRQYETIASQVMKIIKYAHFLDLSGNETVRIIGNPKVAAEEIIERFDMLIEEVDTIYKQHPEATYLPDEANKSLQKILQQGRNLLDIAHQLKKGHPEIYEAMTPQLRALSFLIYDTGLPCYNGKDPLKVAELHDLPLYVRLEAIETRLDTIRWKLDQAMENAKAVIQDNLTTALATAAVDDFSGAPVPIPHEVENMVSEAKRLMAYYRTELKGKIYGHDRVGRHWNGDSRGTTPLKESIPFLEKQINLKKTDQRKAAAVDDLVKNASDYITETAMQIVDCVSDVACSLFY